VYLTGVALVFWAIAADVRILDLLDEGTAQVRIGLRLSAIVRVEAIESFFRHREAVREEARAQSLEDMARIYFAESAADEQYAEQDRERGESYAQMAAEDRAKADALLENVTRDESLLAEMVRNITADQRAENATVQELRKIHEGLCGNKMFQPICDLVGRAGDLQRTADEEYVRIQQEIDAKDQIQKREYMEKLVETALLGEATEYNKTSSELLAAARDYEDRSRQEYLEAAEYNRTGQLFERAAAHEEELAKKDLEYAKSNRAAAERFFAMASAAYQSAVRLAALAAAAAAVALVFFGAKVLVGTRGLVRYLNAWASNERTSEDDFRRCASYCALHVLIFFLAAGMTAEYVTAIGYYGWRERTGIITWFSFLGGFIQTFSLHVVPHVMAEWPLSLENRRSDINNISKHGLLRLATLMPLFGIEFLIVLVASGQAVFSSPIVVRFFGNPFIVLCTSLLLALYVYSFEPRENISTSVESDNHSVSTMLTESCCDDSHDAGASEATPLTTREEDSAAAATTGKGSTSGSTTVALLSMDLGRFGRDEVVASELQSQYSLDSTSPYFVRCKRELFFLKLATEVLFTCCMISVLSDCVPLACRSRFGKRILAGTIAATFLFACALAYRRRRFVSSAAARAGNKLLLGSSTRDDPNYIEIVSV